MVNVQDRPIGMSVAEALGSGLPVITTTAAPWSVVEGEGCGWWVPPTTDGLAVALSQATALPIRRLEDMGMRGRAFVTRELSWHASAKKFIFLYEDTLNRAQH